MGLFGVINNNFFCFVNKIFSGAIFGNGFGDDIDSVAWACTCLVEAKYGLVFVVKPA